MDQHRWHTPQWKIMNFKREKLRWYQTISIRRKKVGKIFCFCFFVQSKWIVIISNHMNFNHYHNRLSAVCYQANWITQTCRINELIWLIALSNNTMNEGEKNDVKLKQIRAWIYGKNFGWNCIKIVLPLNDGYNPSKCAYASSL